MLPPVYNFPVRYRLPVAYSTEIGRIITRWAFLEWRLRVVTYILLGVGHNLGRIAVREPRAADYITIIEDICTVRNIKLKADTKTLKKQLAEYKEFRDLLAHGIWIKHPASTLPTIQKATGSYQELPGQKLTKAKMAPKATVIELVELKKFSKLLQTMTGRIEKLRKEIRDHIPVKQPAKSP